MMNGPVSFSRLRLSASDVILKLMPTRHAAADKTFLGEYIRYRRKSIRFLLLLTINVIIALYAATFGDDRDCAVYHLRFSI